MTRAIAAAGINMIFFIAQVVGRRYSAVIGFETAADAKRATGLIRKAKPAKRR
jgi:sensor domain CHASE-containing protein